MKAGNTTRQLISGMLQGLGSYLRISEASSARARRFRYVTLVLPLLRPVLMRYVLRRKKDNEEVLPLALVLLAVPLTIAVAVLLDRVMAQQKQRPA